MHSEKSTCYTFWFSVTFIILKQMCAKLLTLCLCAANQPEPVIRYKRQKADEPVQPPERISASGLPLAACGCPFSILHYWRPRLGCFPDAMHTIGGVIKDLVRMLMGKHRESRLTANLKAYYLRKNHVDLQTNRKWEVGKCRSLIHHRTLTIGNMAGPWSHATTSR